MPSLVIVPAAEPSGMKSRKNTEASSLLGLNPMRVIPLTPFSLSLKTK